HRIREKTCLVEQGLPVTPFAPVRSEAELTRGVDRVGCPALLKTAAFGYDGKGQVPMAAASDAPPAWDALGRQEAFVEAFVDLEREISVIGARGVGGEWTHFGPIENTHRHHILDV